MALIHCPECGREISDKAAACPHCGYPMTPAAPSSDDEKRLAEARQRDKRESLKIGIWLLIGIAAILIFAFFSGRGA